MRRWNSLSFKQKSEVVGVGLGAFLAVLFSFGTELPARAIGILIGAVIGWGVGRVVASVQAKR
jgi:hypothetical protein